MSVAMIHTSAGLLPTFKALAAELMPGRQVFNVIDESLLCDIQREGRLVATTSRRLVGHVLSAADAGATHILVTCSSMGRAVEASRLLTGSIVLRVDEPMTFEAVGHGRRIGVIATLPSTLEPTASLVSSKARDAGKEVSINALVVPGAFDAVMSGDGARHDALVGEAILKLIPQVDALVLAQASMARVVDALPAGQRTIPILSSPRSAVSHLASLVNSSKETTCR